MDLKDLLGTAVTEAKKHPELLDSVVGLVKGKAGTGSGAKRATAKPAAGKASGAAKRPQKKPGGLSGLLGDLDVAGLTEQVGSWVGTGPNERVSGKKVKEALGPKKISAAAKRAGVSEDEAAAGIAKLLPAVVDYLTPEGKVPTETQTKKRLEVLAKSER
jgi:uncharacterized protein YidB (DUF937 family)